LCALGRNRLKPTTTYLLSWLGSALSLAINSPGSAYPVIIICKETVRHPNVLGTYYHSILANTDKFRPGWKAEVDISAPSRLISNRLGIMISTQNPALRIWNSWPKPIVHHLLSLSQSVMRSPLSRMHPANAGPGLTRKLSAEAQAPFPALRSSTSNTAWVRALVSTKARPQSRVRVQYFYLGLSWCCL
jgi:hypothetical protein